MGLICIICFEHIKENNAAATPCGHIFDRECLANWMRQSDACAVCRKPNYDRQVINIWNFYEEDKYVTELLNDTRNQLTQKHEGEVKILLARIASHESQEESLIRLINDTKVQLTREHDGKLYILEACVDSLTDQREVSEMTISELKKKVENLDQKNKELDGRLDRQSKNFAAHIVENSSVKENEKKLREQAKEKDETIKKILTGKADVVIQKANLKEVNDKLVAKYKKLMESKHQVDEEMRELRKRHEIVKSNCSKFENTLNSKFNINNILELMEKNEQHLETQNQLIAKENMIKEEELASAKKGKPGCGKCEKLIKENKDILSRKSKLEFNLTKANNRCAKLKASLEEAKKENQSVKKEFEKNTQIMTENNAKLFKQKENTFKDLKNLKKKMSPKDDVKVENAFSMDAANLEKKYAEAKIARNRLTRESNKYKQKASALEQKNKNLLQLVEALSTLKPFYDVENLNSTTPRRTEKPTTEVNADPLRYF